MNRRSAIFAAIGMASIVFAGLFGAVASAQERVDSVLGGHRIIYPDSSIPRPGRIHTNYFFVDSVDATATPSSKAETPGSVACVYQLVNGPSGCPMATSMTVPSGGWGAIALVEAGSYPTAATDLAAFSAYYGLPPADLTVVWVNNQKPPLYSDWLVEQALDIEWAHAMAPRAKIYLVESPTCKTECQSDPIWGAVQLAAQLVAEAGGGEVSMSWGDPEASDELGWDQYFTGNNVVFFAATGDHGLGKSSYPAASPNVVAVGGTRFKRKNGSFVSEVYDKDGGGDLSPYEPRPSYQDGVANVVGTHRGYPDVASDFCCTAIYLKGGWYGVGGTSWAAPTFAGIVNASHSAAAGSVAELTTMYDELANPAEYSAHFQDITKGATQCTAGFNECDGIGSPRTYVGK